MSMDTPAIPLVVAARVVESEAKPRFEDFYSQHYPAMVRLAVALCGSVAAAEDVVQDCFARLYLRYLRVEDPSSYLRRSVVNGCVGRFRRSHREQLVAAPNDVAGEHIDETNRIDLTRRLASLPSRQRAAVVLRVQVGLSETETAALLGCRPGTVGSLLHRGLAALRITLEQEDNP